MFQMLKIVLSSLFKKPATAAYPAKPMVYDKTVRGSVECGIDACIFCGLCSRACPTHAIDVGKADKSWEIRRFNCILCGACVEKCPKKCLNMENRPSRASAEKTSDRTAQAQAAATNA